MAIDKEGRRGDKTAKAQIAGFGSLSCRHKRLSYFLVDQTLEASSRPRIAEVLRGCFQKKTQAIWTSADLTIAWQGRRRAAIEFLVRNDRSSGVVEGTLREFDPSVWLIVHVRWERSRRQRRLAAAGDLAARNCADWF